MKVVKNEHTVFFDVDGTLIDFDSDFEGANETYVDDPIVPGVQIAVYPNHANIRLLREEKHRGSHVVVWSRGGYAWAASVLIALGLEDQVDEVMTKPFAYFDDIPIEKWLTNRVFLKPGTPYK